MTKPCRTKCGTEIDYVREEFSDGVFFSIPIETSQKPSLEQRIPHKVGTIHECYNLENAEHDLEAAAGFRPELSDNDLKTTRQFNPDYTLLDKKDRAKYRHDFYELHVDVLYHLEEEIVFPEKRSELRIVIGHFLNRYFYNMGMDPTANYSIITTKFGQTFSIIQLLGLLYQIDGFYLDAKKCYEIQYRILNESLQKCADYDGITVEEHNGPIYLDLIEEMQDRIETNELNELGTEKTKGLWISGGWTGDLADYAKKVKKDQYQDDDTVSEKKETESSQHYDKKQTLDEIQTFEKDILRPAARKLFLTEKELNDKLKELRWKIGFKEKTLFDKAQSRRKLDEGSILEPEDPMNVGLLRYVDIGDLGDIIKSKLKIGLKSEITHDLWEITKHRNKLSHSQDFPEKELMFTNVIIVAMIGRIKPFFENLERR